MHTHLLRCCRRDRGRLHGRPGAAARAEATPTPRLLAQYQPAMRFDPLESFRPTSVQSFIAASDLERLVAPTYDEDWDDPLGAIADWPAG